MKTTIRLAPLALFAISAQAAAIFNIAGTDCVSEVGGAQIAAATTSSLVASPLPLGNGVTGAVLNGSCSDVIPSESNSFTLEASMFGNFAGSDMPLPSTVPVEFDFTIDGFIFEVLDWYVELFVNDASVFSTGGSTSMNPASPMGSGFATGLPTGTLGAADSWKAVAGLSCLFCEGGITIDLGSSSLRVNPAQAPPPPTIPEPSTVSLLALGGVLLWLKRFRKA